MQRRIKSNSIFILITLFLNITLTSCGGGTSSTLPPQPRVYADTEITGTATLGHIRNADILIYAYNGKQRGEVLAQSEVQTNSLGEFSLILKTKSQPILICTRGGVYTEEAATNTEITLEPSQSLCATVNYSSGTTQNITISYYTHLAAGLAQNLINNNKPAKKSIIEANKRISDWLGVDIIKTQPIQMTDTSSINETQLSDAAKYGFANAAVSSLVRWAGIESGQTPFQGITSVSFSQTSYNDIVYDAVLDGQARAGVVSVGTVSLNATVYRHNLALNLLAVVSTANPLNTSGVTNPIRATITSESYVNTVELFLIKPHIN